MENLFINIIEISATSTAAIGIILLISKLAESKFRKKWRYWVWVFLAIYLIVPIKFDLPSAPIQMELPKHEMILTRVEEEKVQNAPVLEDFEDMSTEEPQKEQLEHEAQHPTVTNPAFEEDLSTEPETFVFPIVFVGAMIWLFGMILVCGWNIAMYIRFISRSKPWNRAVQNEYVLELFEELKKEMNIPEKVKIYENRLIKSPMMVGFVNPRVLLPSDALLTDEYEFVLRHELTHYKRGDIFYKFLLMLAASVHWFNPMVGIMCRSADKDIEITCDEAVVKAMEGDRRQEYCATILNIMRRGQNSPLLLSTSFYGGKKFLKSRFAAVLNPKTHRGVALFVIAAIVILISGTMVACNEAENIIDNSQEEQREKEFSESGFPVLSENEIHTTAERLVQFAFTEISYHETGYYTDILSDEAAEYIRALAKGKKEYYEENNIIINGGTYSVSMEELQTVNLSEKTEILFTVKETYEWNNPEIYADFSESTDKYHAKITYNSKTGLFDGFIIYKVTWMDDDSYYVTMGSENDPRPVVEGPKENGTFPFISSADWDRWVTYDGKPETVIPTEPIPSILECKAYLAELTRNYPEITDWEIVYEDCYYELTYSYDPYTYSFREIYMPERFAVLKTEQAEDFDRLVVSTHEDYSAVWQNNGYVPVKDFQSSTFEVFEADVRIGDMSGAEHYQTQYAVTRGIWFPEEKRMLQFDPNFERVFEVNGISEPICITSYDYFGKWTYHIDGNTIVKLDEGRKDDLCLYVSENGGGHKEEIAAYYYYGDTKTIKKIEDSDANEQYSYPRIWFLDSETMIIDNGLSINFYDVSAGADATVCVNKIDAGALSKNQIRTEGFISEDKTVSGRYLMLYQDLETGMFWMSTFDEEKILSNFNLGLSSDGYFGSVNYHDGLVYFSYHYRNGGGRTNYAVDARPERDHTLQADAW